MWISELSEYRTSFCNITHTPPRGQLRLGATHRCCRRMETQPSRPAGCPGSPPCRRRCLPPAGTWAGSRSSSLGSPGCPSPLTSEPVAHQQQETSPSRQSEKPAAPTVRVCVLLCSLKQHKGRVCHPMNSTHPATATVLKKGVHEGHCPTKKGASKESQTANAS